MSAQGQYNHDMADLLNMMRGLGERIVSLDERLTTKLQYQDEQIAICKKLLIGNGDKNAHVMRLAQIESEVHKLRQDIRGLRWAVLCSVIGIFVTLMAVAVLHI